jgi:hypothetical protein
MMYREFRVPTDEELEIAFGSAPTPGDEVGVRFIHFQSEDGADVDLTVDALGRSVTLVVTRGVQDCLRLTREGATELNVSAASPEIMLHFRTEDTTGHLEVSLKPWLRVVETTLLT